MLNTRTIISGSVTLGAPLYNKGEYQGTVESYFRPVEDCGYEFIDLKVADVGYKFCVIEGNNIYIPDDCSPIVVNDNNIEMWCGTEGFIGAGDINDGEQVYYRNHGDTSLKLNPKSFICEQFRAVDMIKHNDKWSCSDYGTVKIVLDFYQNDELRFLIPVALYSHDYYTQKYIDVFKIDVFYCNKYSLNNLF